MTEQGWDSILQAIDRVDNDREIIALNRVIACIDDVIDVGVEVGR